MTGFDEALTPDELDALPAGSTVVDDEGKMWTSATYAYGLVLWDLTPPERPYGAHTSRKLVRLRGPVRQVTAYGGVS